MELRLAFAPSLSIPQGRSFIKGAEIWPCLHTEKPGSSLRKSAAKFCHRLIIGSLKTEELEDSTLVDIQESSNGYVLFKFGTTQLYDDPPRFISSVAQNKSTTCMESASEIIDCSAVVYRLPEGNTALNSFYRPAAVKEGHFEALNSSRDYKNRWLLEGRPVASLSPRTLCGLPSDFIRPYKLENFASLPSNVDLEYGEEPILKLLRASSYDVAMAKLLPANISLENVRTCLTNADINEVHAMKSSTSRGAGGSTKKVKARHKKLSNVATRDLFKGNSFHLYELIFSYPFMDSRKGSSTWKGIPKEKYGEVFAVLNQIAVALAGSGLAMVLFVASRLLCVNATLDSTKLMSFLQGVGLIWLSTALQKFGSAVRHMADVGGKSRPQRKEHLAVFRKEVHAVTFKVCTIVMLSMVRLA